MKYKIQYAGMSPKKYMYNNVTRAKDDILYMAYYFPQFHTIPENIINGKYYTDWDFIKDNPQKSFTPHSYYNLSEKYIYDEQDDLANKFKIGVFIFYHYWLDNTMIMNLPIDLFAEKKRKTKFMLCWDNETGLLGKQLYDSPEKHAYSLIKYFLNDNYLTDINGEKPFIVYQAQEANSEYIKRFVKFLLNYNIKLKIGTNYQERKTNFYIPEWSRIAVEFGPHMNSGIGAPTIKTYEYIVRDPNIDEYWQGAITSWDSRPRRLSGRTHQNQAYDEKEPNGEVSYDKFKESLDKIKKNISYKNKDKVITLFAWNEWSEGATLEKSIEHANKFINQLGGDGKGTSKEKLNKTLEFFSNLLNKNSINDWFIGYGTLLGIIRENSCIDGDDDVDIIINKIYYDKIKSLLIDNDFEIEYGYGINDSKDILKTKEREDYSSIDFYMAEVDNNGNFNDKWEDVIWSNCYYNKKLIKYNWNNLEIQIPNNYKSKLINRYGDEWHIKRNTKGPTPRKKII